VTGWSGYALFVKLSTKLSKASATEALAEWLQASADVHADSTDVHAQRHQPWLSVGDSRSAYSNAL